MIISTENRDKIPELDKEKDKIIDWDKDKEKDNTADNIPYSHQNLDIQSLQI